MRSTGAARPRVLSCGGTPEADMGPPKAPRFDGRLGLLLDAGFGMKMNAALAFEKYIIAAQVRPVLCALLRFAGSIAGSILPYQMGQGRQALPLPRPRPRPRPWPWPWPWPCRGC